MIPGPWSGGRVTRIRDGDTEKDDGFGFGHGPREGSRRARFRGTFRRPCSTSRSRPACAICCPTTRPTWPICPARLQDVFSSFGYRRLFLPTLERLEVIERGLSPSALANALKFVEPGSGEVVVIRPGHHAADRPAVRSTAGRAAGAGPALLRRSGPARPRGAGGRATGAVPGRRRAAGRGRARRRRRGARAAGARAGAGRALRGERRGGTRRVRGVDDRGCAAARRGAGRRLGRAGAQGRGDARPAGPAWPRQRRGQGGPAGAGRTVRRRRAARAAAPCRGVRRARPRRWERSRLHCASLAAAGFGRSRSIWARRAGWATTRGSRSPGYAPGAGSRVAAGGRYDGLLARFGRPDPAIGFAIDLEFATQALERTIGRGRTARPAWAPGRGARRRGKR